MEIVYLYELVSNHIIDEKVYNASKEKYGMALCSRECGVKAGKINENLSIDFHYFSTPF